jgi:hypothetical protein
MRRWDRILDSYIEEYAARGVSKESVAMNKARLDRWGRWLKARRPRVSIESTDVDSITRYIESCSTFKAKATVYGTLSSSFRRPSMIGHARFRSPKLFTPSCSPTSSIIGDAARYFARTSNTKDSDFLRTSVLLPRLPAITRFRMIKP